MQKFQWDLDTAIFKIQGKLFLFAHHIWLNNHKNKLFSIKSLIESENSTGFISRRKAYTLTKLPKFLVFNLEFEEYFNFSMAGAE